MNYLIGQCLCGAVKFRFVPVGDVVMSCFCSICRRSHGADYATQLLSKKSSLEYVFGDECVQEYASSPMGIRTFCKQCGSRLMNYAKEKSDYMSVALSSVISDHSYKPAANVQVASKAPWAEPNRSIPCFDVFPPDMHQYL